jgi:hypothetical protein
VKGIALSNHHHDEDDAQLAALGFDSTFKRDMSLWANFSLPSPSPRRGRR